MLWFGSVFFSGVVTFVHLLVSVSEIWFGILVYEAGSVYKLQMFRHYGCLRSVVDVHEVPC